MITQVEGVVDLLIPRQIAPPNS